MTEFYASLSDLGRVYFFCAIVGGALFTASFLMRLVMGGMDVDGDGIGSSELGGGDTSDSSQTGGDGGFRFISIQGLTAFTMMFGLTGLSVLTDFETDGVLSLAIAVSAGVAIVWCMKKIFDFFLRLRSSGNVMIESALSEIGVVYMTIPEDGVGKVQLTVQGRHRTMEAISKESDEIPTGTKVHVTDFDHENRLVVTRHLSDQ